MKFMKTALLTAIFLAAFQPTGFSQEREIEGEEMPQRPTWSFATGSMIYFFRQDVAGVPITGLNTLAVLGARYNFKYLGKSTAIAVGSYPGAGLAFFSGFSGAGNTYFSFDLPLLLELHTGADAHPDMQKQLPVGFFIGGGLGLNFLSRQFFVNNPSSGFSYGPTGSGGLKFNIGQRGIMLRGSYLYNLNKQLPDLKAIGLLWRLNN
jgi:hypothetical protein